MLYCLSWPILCRNIALRDLQSRKLMEELYGTMSVSNKIGNAFAKVITPAMLSAGCMGIIVATFMSLGDLNLPFVLRLFCPFAALAAAGMVFEQIYEGVCFTRKSQEIIARLQSTDQLYLKGLSRKQKDGLLKRAKAFRPIVVPIGSFCNVSMGVIQVTWDEVLNQILFLFSL